eukprot:CAMPEP_0114519442 /NCGR_PEP_ID=MMETSP0109-20121206/19006_1 /TAXON_ID=29199 /ORGANISM="Chlorarachnion reptans, Strain CCCM449" /LENGTH=258 /DNA_ID=CAMNT_0001700183 /DNA_START=59 /DNA_END=835 /DNA_ORIENTATION=-
MIPGISLQMKKTLSMYALCIGLKVFWATQFQVGEAVDNEEMSKGWTRIRKSLSRGKSVFLLVNHVSRLDGLLMAMVAPMDVTAKCKTLMNITLFRQFLVGRIWELCGHLPVYFKSDEHGKFKVDQEKQAVVSKELREFMETGKILIFCPEGQINKEPRTLQPFRRGSFRLPTELKMDIWAFTTHNAHVTWPKKAAFGGVPTTLNYTLTKIHDGDSASVPEDPNSEEFKATYIKLAASCQKAMQVEVDKFYALESKQDQ